MPLPAVLDHGRENRTISVRFRIPSGVGQSIPHIFRSISGQSCLVGQIASDSVGWSDRSCMSCARPLSQPFVTLLCLLPPCQPVFGMTLNHSSCPSLSTTPSLPGPPKNLTIRNSRALVRLSLALGCYHLPLPPTQMSFKPPPFFPHFSLGNASGSSRMRRYREEPIQEENRI